MGRKRHFYSGVFFVAVNNSMNFEFYTLIDITQTNARFSKSDPAWHQQQNHLTFIQTLSLRVNPYIDKLNVIEVDLKDLAFGSKYKGKHKVWHGTFHIEYVGGLTVDMLEKDFNLVPIINNLDETVQLKDCVFDTSNKQTKNIIFKCVD